MPPTSLPALLVHLAYLNIFIAASPIDHTTVTSRNADDIHPLASNSSLGRGEARCSPVYPSFAMEVDYPMPNPLNVALRGFYNPLIELLCIDAFTSARPNSLLLHFEQRPFTSDSHETRILRRPSDEYHADIEFLFVAVEGPHGTQQRVLLAQVTGVMGGVSVDRGEVVGRMDVPEGDVEDVDGSSGGGVKPGGGPNTTWWEDALGGQNLTETISTF